MIPRIHAGGRGVRGLVAYITHDASSPGEPQPTTDERVGLVAGLNLPTDDPHLASLIMARTAADPRTSRSWPAHRAAAGS